MKGKKGFDISMKFVIMWIILPLVAGVMIVVLVVAPTASALGSKGYADNLCHLNAGFRHWVIPGGKWVIPLAMCHEKSVTVDADNWNACDPDGKFRFKELAKTNEYDALRKCTAQQFYNLGARCWYMYGQDQFNLQALEMGRWNCFRTTVRDLQGTIGKDELMAASKLADGGKFLPDGNVDFQKKWLSTETVIETNSKYYVCFDDNGGGPDQVDYEDNSCG